MKKKHVLFLFLIMLLSITFFIGSPVKASNEVNNTDSNASVEKYEELIQNGILSNNIKYKNWIDIEKQVKKEEAIYLENNKAHLKENKIAKRASVVKVVKGDILITNGTSSNGFTGHVGIAVSSQRVLHTANKNSVPEVISLKKWIKKYGLEAPDEGFIPTNTEVYRIKNIDKFPFSSYPAAAADWARNTFENSGYAYEINFDLFSLDPTYCSKIVWQAYYHAGGQWGSRFIETPITNIPTPYGMPTYFKNGMELELVKII